MKDCPFCKPNRKPFDPYRESQCTLNKPLFMVIPPGGVHLECPVHPEGHHVFGPQVTFMRENNLPDPANKPWCEYQHDSSKDLTFDSTRPYGTATGNTINDTNKFSM